MFKKNIIKFLKFIYTIRIILKKYAFAPLDAAPRKKYVQKAITVSTNTRCKRNM